MLEEFKSDEYHYFKDAQARRQGEYKDLYDNDQLRIHCFYVDDKRHGESKTWNVYGTLLYHYLFVHGEVYRDLIKEPVTDDQEKFMITLETGGGWLC
jgi:hypothetical protein